MDIVVVCPSCDMEYTIDENMCGRQLACKCGEKFVIPLLEEENDVTTNHKNEQSEPVVIEPPAQRSNLKISNQTKPQAGIDPDSSIQEHKNVNSEEVDISKVPPWKLKDVLTPPPPSSEDNAVNEVSSSPDQPLDENIPLSEQDLSRIPPWKIKDLVPGPPKESEGENASENESLSNQVRLPNQEVIKDAGIALKKTCPKCREHVDSDGVICTKCGYNFVTRGNVAEEAGGGEEEKVNIFIRLFPLIKIFIILLVLGGVGFGVYYFMTKQPYGISQENPLGTYKEYDALLIKMRLTKDSPRSIPSDFGTTGKIITYTDEKLKTKSKGIVEESVFLVLDNSGKLCGIGGTCCPLADSVPAADSKLTRFLNRLWFKVFNWPKPKFKEIRHGSGNFAWTENIARIKSRDFRGRWKKTEGPNPLYGSTDKIVFALTKYNVDTLISSNDSGFDQVQSFPIKIMQKSTSSSKKRSKKKKKK